MPLTLLCTRFEESSVRMAFPMCGDVCSIMVMWCEQHHGSSVVMYAVVWCATMRHSVGGVYDSMLESRVHVSLKLHFCLLLRDGEPMMRYHYQCMDNTDSTISDNQALPFQSCHILLIVSTFSAPLKMWSNMYCGSKHNCFVFLCSYFIER